MRGALSIKSVLLMSILVGVMVAAAPAAAEKLSMSYQLAPQVDVTGIEYFIDDQCKIADKPCLTFNLTLKNVSEQPTRFITRITLPEEGKSVGGFVPRKGKKDPDTGKKLPPAVAPGEETTVKYPMFHYEAPQAVEVEVMAYE